MNIKNINKDCDIKGAIFFSRLFVVFLLQMSNNHFLVWMCDLSCHLTAILLFLCFRCHAGPIRNN